MSEENNQDSPYIEFINEFQRDPDKASHLISVYEYFRQSKRASTLCLIIAYFTFAASFTGVNFTEGRVRWILYLFLLVLAFNIVSTMILWLDLNRHEISSNELALHELAQAVSNFDGESTNYDKWKGHLTNTSMLIEYHGARIFSGRKEQQFQDYVNWVEEVEPTDENSTHFNHVFDMFLYALVDEYNLTPDWIEYDNGTTESLAGGFRSTIKRSSRNILDHSGAARWIPIITVLGFGLGIFFFYNERLGSMITIALLTVISLRRSNKS